MGRTPHKKIRAAEGTVSEAPVDGWSPWAGILQGANARLVTDGCRALLMHGRVSRMSEGGDECGFRGQPHPTVQSACSAEFGRALPAWLTPIRRNAPGVACGSDPLVVGLSWGRYTAFPDEIRPESIRSLCS